MAERVRSDFAPGSYVDHRNCRIEMIQNVKALAFGIQGQTSGTKSHSDPIDDSAAAIEHADFFRTKRGDIGFIAVWLKYQVQRLRKTDLAINRSMVAGIPIDVRVQVHCLDSECASSQSFNASDPIVRELAL
jgi:hypothetical protein